MSIMQDVSTTRQCTKCSRSFNVTAEDMEFYDKVSPEFAGEKYSIPAPTRCPDCRHQRHTAWCNEQFLYHNTCALTGKPVISYLPAENPRPVWNFRDWWSDAFNAFDYGQEIDWTLSVFDQFHNLEKNAPHACVNTDLENENSEYTHYAGHEKNCYLLFHASYAEDCMYGYGIKKAVSCVDNYYCHESELCFECIDVKNCYDLAWCQDCQNCNSCRFIRDCSGCTDCLLSVGLRNKQYCILNEQFTKEEYLKRKAELNFGSYEMMNVLLEKYKDLQKNHAWKHVQNEMTENSTGNHLTNAKNCTDCFDASDIEDSKFCNQLQLGVKSCYDIYQFGINIELCYESAQIGYNIYNCQFCFELLEGCSDLLYCMSCFSCKDCFGCFGLRKAQYCIFNKQYSKEEYEQLVPKLIAKMQADGQWGEFFPIAHSHCAYNETTANLWYPLSKEDALIAGYSWFDNPKNTETYMGPIVELVDDITDVSEDICNEVLVCEITGKPYKITPQELAFYQKMNVPLPRYCYEERHRQRFTKRRGRSLSARQCTKCSKDIYSNYLPEDSTQVYCEDCYLATAY